MQERELVDTKRNGGRREELWELSGFRVAHSPRTFWPIRSFMATLRAALRNLSKAKPFVEESKKFRQSAVS